MGDDSSDESQGPSSSQIASGFIAGASTGAATAMSTGSDVAGAISGGLLAAAPFTGPAAPFVAALGLIVAPIAKMFSGCGSTCTIATQDANQAAQALDQILNLYYRSPVRTVSMQQAALQQVQQVIAWLQQACGNTQLGKAGQNCISERLTPNGSPGGCVNTASPGMSPGDPGIPAGSPCNVYTYYINRIAGDTAVVPDPTVLSSVSSAIPSLSSLPSWAIPAALLVGAWALMS